MDSRCVVCIYPNNKPELPQLAKFHCQNCAVWTSRTTVSKPMLYLSRRRIVGPGAGMASCEEEMEYDLYHQ